tara:strand:+ start:3203 stop:4303 length:1101 start_codon:yes stop_codon:yes gene_type:complete
MIGNVKIYESIGQIAIQESSFPVRFFNAGDSLTAIRDGDNVTIQANMPGSPSTTILTSVPHSKFKKKDGTSWGSGAATVVSALNVLFNDDNPSDFATATSVANLVDRIRRITQTEDDSDGGGTDGDGDSGGGGDVWVISVSDQHNVSGVVKVRESSSLMGVGQSELFVDENKLKFSVRSNTGNAGSETKTEAIRITGEENSSNSTVDVKGVLRVSQRPFNNISFLNASQTDGLTSYSGDTTFLAFPASPSYTTRMIGKSVSFGNVDDPINKGQRNYIEITGLSTGDEVSVTVAIDVTSTSSHSVILRHDKSSTATTQVDNNFIGTATTSLTLTNTVDNYTAMRYHLELNTSGSGTYKVRSAKVTIS